MTRALLMGPEEHAAILNLRERAALAPVDILRVQEILKHPDSPERQAHRATMTAQSIPLPMGFLVTYSVETGHPPGIVRHMSVSVDAPGRAPSPEAVALIAEEFGFVGGLE